MPSDLYAEVIVNLPVQQVDHSFHYRIPGPLAGKVRPGQVVMVPFSGRQLLAYVVALGESEPGIDASKLKELSRIVVSDPVLSGELLDLAGWMSEEYMCLLVESIHAMVPPGIRLNTIKPRVQSFCEIACSLEETRTLLQGLRRNAPKQAALLETLAGLIESGRESVSVTTALRLSGSSRDALAGLVRKGYVRVESRRIARTPQGVTDPADLGVKDTERSLTEEQQSAVEEIRSCINARRKAVVLLHGVTGSGKTEVYLRSVRDTINTGRKALVLVPEISLTPQTIAWFRSRFGNRVAVLHSGLAEGERYDEWTRIRQGQVDVVVGARSAVFAPLDDIGLIVIDEEHELSYRQQEPNPRYHAVEVAVRRAGVHGATVVLGSATPSVETYYKALSGEYSLVRLKRRVSGRGLPPVEVVDMRAELKAGNRTIFSRSLSAALKKCVASGRQAILFLNRRGASSFALCRDCGHVLKCRNCDISLTLHERNTVAKCHYCGYWMRVPPRCPNCGGDHFRQFGIGTEGVELALLREFDSIRPCRLDAETTRGKDSAGRILAAFGRGEYNVLVGTQMVAKGLDFPLVSVVGVINADTALHLPDFRSAERTFQLLTQVAGRAGRSSSGGGRVIVQTYNPDHYAIVSAAAHDYEGFYKTETEFRRKAVYPPFSEMIRILVSGPDEEACRKASADLANLLRESGIEGVYDATPSPLSRLRGRYRFNVLIKTLDLQGIKPLVRECVKAFKKSRMGSGRQVDVTATVDIRPSSVL